jgi:hypothetical protein
MVQTRFVDRFNQRSRFLAQILSPSAIRSRSVALASLCAGVDAPGASRREIPKARPPRRELICLNVYYEKNLWWNSGCNRRGPVKEGVRYH